MLPSLFLSNITEARDHAKGRGLQLKRLGMVRQSSRAGQAAHRENMSKLVPRSRSQWSNLKDCELHVVRRGNSACSCWKDCALHTRGMCEVQRGRRGCTRTSSSSGHFVQSCQKSQERSPHNLDTDHVKPFTSPHHSCRVSNL